MTADALAAFQGRLRCSGLVVDDLDAVSAVGSMLAFYASDRPADCTQADGDMLLFQWGIFDWGSGPTFEYDITRQLITAPGEDEDIWQLSLTLRYPPDEECARLESGNRWHAAPEDLEEFAGFIARHPATVYATAHRVVRVQLDWGTV